jgi:hypothetical protein
MTSEDQLYTLSQVAAATGLPERLLREKLAKPEQRQVYFSIPELASRWRCSRGSVYNRLRSVGAKVLDFAANGKKCKKVVPAAVVAEIECKKTRIFR